MLRNPRAVMHFLESVEVWDDRLSRKMQILSDSLCSLTSFRYKNGSGEPLTPGAASAAVRQQPPRSAAPAAGARAPLRSTPAPPAPLQPRCAPFPPAQCPRFPGRSLAASGSRQEPPRAPPPREGARGVDWCLRKSNLRFRSWYISN